MAGLFDNLKRLFSTDVVIKNDSFNNLKLIDINKIQQSGDFETNSLVDRYNRLYHSNSPSSLYGAQVNTSYKYRRHLLYSEYDIMDNDAIIASALDIIADECILKNDLGDVLHIKSSDENIQKTLYNLFYDVLNIEFNMWSWIRQMCKYGDMFLKLEIADKIGVYNVIPYSALSIERIENFDPKNPYSVKFQYNQNGYTGYQSSGYYGANADNDSENVIMFDNYEIAHFRLISDVNYLPYGRSYIEPARKLYKQYSLMEDSMLIHRITRASDRRIFYMNVAGIPSHEIEPFMQKTISNMKRTPVIDPNTGEYNLKYNMQNLMEDYYIPVKGNDQTTKIETAPGLNYDGIADVVYLRDKLFAALKVPKAFMGYEKDLTGKATLAAEDVRFARTIDRIQKIIISELYKIALVHLYSQGYNDSSLTNFELNMTTPSIIYDQERIALMKEKMDLANTMVESKLFPSDYVYENLFHLSEEQYREMRNLVIEDTKRKFRNTQIEGEGNDPNITGKSFGTPHDLASLYGTRRNPEDISIGNKDAGGRPIERASNINTQNNAFGIDRLGKNDNNIGQIHENINARINFEKNKNIFSELDKKLIVKSDIDENSMLDETQLN